MSTFSDDHASSHLIPIQNARALVDAIRAMSAGEAASAHVAAAAAAPGRAPAAPAPAIAAPAAAPAAAEAATLRASVDKVDPLINLVGELVITQAMLAKTSARMDAALYQQLAKGLADLDRNTRGLQESVMSIRMIATKATAPPCWSMSCWASSRWW